MSKYKLKLKGTVGGWNFDKDYVDYILDKYKESSVNVLIDSLGGSVASALSIVASFREHGNVNVHFVGMNASAATIVSLGAKHISIDTNAMYLVHKCSQRVFEWSSMNADQLAQKISELEKQKKDLEKIDLNIASLYSAKCKKDKEALLELMAQGGWLTAQEALEWGFVDEITDAPEDCAPVITDDLASAMADAGIPPLTSRLAQSDNFIAKIANAIKAVITPKSISNTMNKIFTSICALLAVQSIALTDGKASLTEEQLSSIEDALASKDAEINALKDTVAQRDATIASLESKSDVVTTTVMETSKTSEEITDSPIVNYCNAMAKAKELYGNI